MKDRRDDARPRLKIVNDALNDLFELAKNKTTSFCLSDEEVFKDAWEAIIDKHDLNYNDLNRWPEV